jgi:zinc transporter
MQTEFVYGYYFNPLQQVEKITSLDKLDVNKPHWLHFDFSLSSTKHWIDNQSGLPNVVASALLDEETRPRATPLNDGVLT